MKCACETNIVSTVFNVVLQYDICNEKSATVYERSVRRWESSNAFDVLYSTKMYHISKLYQCNMCATVVQ